MDNYRWSLETLIWMPVAALLTLVCVVAAVLFLMGWRRERKSDRSYSDAGLFLGSGIVAIVCALMIVGGTAWGMWPYEAEYHQWRETSGVVQDIDSRLLSSSDSGPTERFVVTFEDGEQRSCDDTRCAQVSKGDKLTLACKRRWQWTGTHGYDCNYTSHVIHGS